MKTSARAAAVIAAIVGLVAGSAARAADDFINILTGGTSGVYYPMGVALSKIYTEKIAGSRPSVQATKASVENLNLLQQGKGEIAFVRLTDDLELTVRPRGGRDASPIAALAWSPDGRLLAFGTEAGAFGLIDAGRWSKT